MDSAADFDISNYKLVLIDESQRIRDNQLEVILNKSIENQIPIIFSYDVKQFLRMVKQKIFAIIWQLNILILKCLKKN